MKEYQINDLDRIPTMEDAVMNDLERRICAYGDRNWPDADVAHKLRKLGEEFGELAEAIVRGDRLEIQLEAADMAILLTHIVKKVSKKNYCDSLMAWMATKLDRLEERDRINRIENGGK